MVGKYSEIFGFRDLAPKIRRETLRNGLKLYSSAAILSHTLFKMGCGPEALRMMNGILHTVAEHFTLLGLVVRRLAFCRFVCGAW